MRYTPKIAPAARRLFGFAMLCTVAAMPVAAQNAVQNPNFSGGFSSYTSPGISLGLTKLGLGSTAPSGGNELLLGTGSGLLQNSLSQTLSTTAGQNYTISFYAFNPSPNDGTNSLSVMFGGSQVFGQPISNTIYQQFIVSANATSSSTLFELFVQNNADFTHIDDLSVTPGTMSTVPEPSALALLGTGLVGLVPMARRRRAV